MCGKQYLEHCSKTLGGKVVALYIVEVLNMSTALLYFLYLRQQWGNVCHEVKERKELVTTGRNHLTSYAEQTTPFRVWLSGAEERLELLGPMPRNKEGLFSHVEEFDVSD